ncbi:hypothetical protein PYR66_09985 [Klebsiella aerogenes]|nr:hypothetical protein PYR66_09985 [Klebsiella aerogenes]
MSKDIYEIMKSATAVMREAMIAYVQWDSEELPETAEQEAIHDAFRSIDVREQEDLIAAELGLKDPFNPEDIKHWLK